MKVTLKVKMDIDLEGFSRVGAAVQAAIRTIEAAFEDEDGFKVDWIRQVAEELS